MKLKMNKHIEACISQGFSQTHISRRQKNLNFIVCCKHIQYGVDTATAAVHRETHCNTIHLFTPYHLYDNKRRPLCI